MCGCVHLRKPDSLTLFEKCIAGLNKYASDSVREPPHVTAPHLVQPGRRGRLGWWAPLRGRRGRRRTAAACPAPAPGPGAPPAAPWFSLLLLPLVVAAAAAALPLPGSPGGGPSCHGTGDREAWRETELDGGGRSSLTRFRSRVTFWKQKNGKMLHIQLIICGSLYFEELI